LPAPGVEAGEQLALAAGQVAPLQLAVDELHRVGQHGHLLGHALDGGDQLVVAAAGLPEALLVEEPPGQLAELVGVPRRQVQAERELLAVVQVDLRAGDGGLALPQVRRGLVAQRLEDGLDVLAGAEGVGLEVGAGAGVVADLEAADTDLVLAAGGGVGDAVVAEDAVLAQVLDGKLLGAGALPAEVDLFFPQHGGSFPRGPGSGDGFILPAKRSAAEVGCGPAYAGDRIFG
jgi:hypothetical protein